MPERGHKNQAQRQRIAFAPGGEGEAISPHLLVGISNEPSPSLCRLFHLPQYALESLEDLVGAEHHYEHSLRLDPSCTTTLYNLANTQHDLQKLDAAADSYRAVVSFEPENADAHFSLGVVLQDAGRLFDARNAYCTAINLDPTIEDARAAIAGIDAALQQTPRRGTYIEAKPRA